MEDSIMSRVTEANEQNYRRIKKILDEVLKKQRGMVEAQKKYIIEVVRELVGKDNGGDNLRRYSLRDHTGKECKGDKGGDKSHGSRKNDGKGKENDKSKGKDKGGEVGKVSKAGERKRKRPTTTSGTPSRVTRSTIENMKRSRVEDSSEDEDMKPRQV